MADDYLRERGYDAWALPAIDPWRQSLIDALRWGYETGVPWFDEATEYTTPGYGEDYTPFLSEAKMIGSGIFDILAEEAGNVARGAEMIIDPRVPMTVGRGFGTRVNPEVADALLYLVPGLKKAGDAARASGTFLRGLLDEPVRAPGPLAQQGILMDALWE